MILRQIHHQYSKKIITPNSKKLIHTNKIALANNVISIIDGAINSDIEKSLERVLPYLSPDVITTVLTHHQQQFNHAQTQLGFRFFVFAMREKRLHCWESHGLVISMLQEDYGFDLYWKTLEDLKSLEISVPALAFSVLIDAYAKTGLAEKAVESFGKMGEFQCKPEVFTYNRVLRVMLQKKVFYLALAVYNQMLKLNCNPDQSTYTLLIDGLCKSGMTKEALKLYDEMIHRKILPNVRTYTIVISGLCKSGKTDDALKLFDDMRMSGCHPDSITYNALLDGVCKFGSLDEALWLLQDFQKHGYTLGVNGYSCLIDGMFEAKRFDEGYQLYMKMVGEGLKPDIVLYTIMIRGFSQMGNLNGALDLFRKMTGLGLVPDTYCYNAVIKIYCDMGLLDKARSLRLEISEKNCFPNTCTYTILICGMCKNGLVEEAHQIFNEMEVLGCFPSVVTFNALIDGLCKSNRLEEAQHLFYKMEVEKNCPLFIRLTQGSDRVRDSMSLQTKVAKLCESGLVLEAYKLLMKLADSGVLPDITTYNILINGMCKALNINGALGLYKELQRKHIPDSVTYATLINGLFRVDRDDDAFVIFEQMLKSGCRRNSDVYKSLMTWSCKRTKVSLAFSLWLKYLRNFPIRDSQLLELIEEKFEQGELESAIRGLIEMDLKLKDFDLAPYTIWLIGFCLNGNIDHALKIFSVLNEFKINITPPSCVVLIRKLCDVGNLDSMLDIFRYTMQKGMILRPGLCNMLVMSLLGSRDKSKHTHDLLSRMVSAGYDLDTHLCQSTKVALDKENLCLYGLPNETWEVNLHVEGVPPEFPEPALGINFATDGMQKKDWLSLVAVPQ